MLILEKFGIVAIASNQKVLLYNAFAGVLLAFLIPIVNLQSVEVDEIIGIAPGDLNHSTIIIRTREGDLYTLDLLKIMEIKEGIDSSLRIKGTDKIKCEVTPLKILPSEIYPKIVRLSREAFFVVEKDRTSIFPYLQEKIKRQNIATHSMYFTRASGSLVKDLLDINGYVKSISSKNLELLDKSEKQDFGTSLERIIPKLLYLSINGSNIRCNMVELFWEDKSEVSFLTYSSNLYKDDYIYGGIENISIDTDIRVASNGSFFSVVESTKQRAKIYRISNTSLARSETHTPITKYLHPLSTIECIYAMAGSQVCWHSDFMVFAMICFVDRFAYPSETLLKSVDDISSDALEPRICFFGVDPRTFKPIPMKSIKVGNDPVIFGGPTFACYSMGKENNTILQSFSVSKKGVVLNSTMITDLPDDLVWNTDKTICASVNGSKIKFQYYETSQTSELVLIKGSDKIAIIEDHIKSIEFWMSMLIVFTSDSIVLVFPSTLVLDPLVIKIASTRPDVQGGMPRELLLPGKLSLLKMMDRRLIITNEKKELQLIPLEESILQAYLYLEYGSNNMVHEIAQKSSVDDQFQIIDFFWVGSITHNKGIGEFKAPCLVSLFPSMLIRSLAKIKLSNRIPGEIKDQYISMASSLDKSLFA